MTAISRRDFVRMTACGAAGSATLMLPRLNRLAAEAAGPPEGRFDLVIAGGGLGGVAAALAALRSGQRVAMTEETDWIGGQLTAAGGAARRAPWIETHGSTRWYRELRTGVRDYYKRYYPLTDEARARAELNPGNGAVSRLCLEPRVALAVLEGLLAPHIATGRLDAAARACRGCGRRRGRPRPLGHGAAACGRVGSGCCRRRTSSTRPNWATCCR